MQKKSQKTRLIGLLAAGWGILGFFLLIGSALMKLADVSHAALQSTPTMLQWLLLIINIVFMAYSEGYKGFQKNYSPRLAARALYLTRSRSYVELILAPLFCMGFFNAPRKRIIVSLLLFITIIILITVFRQIPQPWRGILDAGVVVGLFWGLCSTAWFCFKAFTDPEFTADPEIAYRSY